MGISTSAYECCCQSSNKNIEKKHEKELIKHVEDGISDNNGKNEDYFPSHMQIDLIKESWMKLQCEMMKVGVITFIR